MKLSFFHFCSPEIRRHLIMLFFLPASELAYAADDECFVNGVDRDIFLSMPNVAVAMRIDGGLERAWVSASGENRFDNSSEFLVLKIVKGNLDPVIVIRGSGVNTFTYLGKMALIAIGDPLPDGSYGFDIYDSDIGLFAIYGTRFPFSFNSNSELPFRCKSSMIRIQ